MILIGILSMAGRVLPKGQAAMAILAGICAWATVFASLFSFEPLNLFASAGGAIVYPLWFAVLGIRLIRGLPRRPTPEGTHP